MARKKIEDYPCVLVVEGYGDLLFYAEMLEALAKLEKVFIQPIGGKDHAKTFLETFISPSLLNDKTHIGFVFDADNEPENTRNSLQSILSKLTGQQVVDGQWTNGSPRIGLFIVPGGNQQGEIETLVWNSWANDAQNTPAKQCVETYVDCMKNAGKTAHSPHKGLIGALLSIRSDEDPRLGPGARDGVFDLGRPELQPLRQFLDGF